MRQRDRENPVPSVRSVRFARHPVPSRRSFFSVRFRRILLASFPRVRSRRTFFGEAVPAELSGGNYLSSFPRVFWSVLFLSLCLRRTFFGGTVPAELSSGNYLSSFPRAFWSVLSLSFCLRRTFSAVRSCRTFSPENPRSVLFLWSGSARSPSLTEGLRAE